MSDRPLTRRTRGRIGIGTLIVVAGLLVVLAIVAGVALTVAGFL